MGSLNGVGVQMKAVEFSIDDDDNSPPFHTSTAIKASQQQQQQQQQQQRRRQQQAQPQVPQPAQIRPSCLSRRTSFRFVILYAENVWEVIDIPKIDY